jgi:transcriptional regulator with XRE-family HTH domain
MTSVGEILRRERQAQGREMTEIAEDLCITQRYLRAIEEDDLKSLPGTFFYKSFVKQYASLLGIDDTTLQSGVDALTAVEEPLPLPGANPKYPLRAVDPIVADANRRYFSDRRVALPVAAFVLVLLGCSGFYTWWNKASRGVEVAKRQANAGIAIPVASTSKPGVDVTTEKGPDGVNHVVLNLSATETTWLSITSEGKNIFSGVLEPSETKTLRASDVAKMKVGNAGGLDVRWNGKSIGPIGPRGKVREVLFTPDNFKILAPPPPQTTL